MTKAKARGIPRTVHWTAAAAVRPEQHHPAASAARPEPRAAAAVHLPPRAWPLPRAHPEVCSLKASRNGTVQPSRQAMSAVTMNHRHILRVAAVSRGQVGTHSEPKAHAYIHAARGVCVGGYRGSSGSNAGTHLPSCMAGSPYRAVRVMCISHHASCGAWCTAARRPCTARRLTMGCWDGS